MKIYYVANARMPTEKAHGIQIAKMCEALIEAGADAEIIVPRRGGAARSVKDFYGLRVDIPTVRVWTPDWYGKKIGFWISSCAFMWGYARHLRKKRRMGDAGVVWAIDIDQFSFSFIPFLGMPYIAEIHDAKPWSALFALLFRRARRIIVINDIIRQELAKIFNISPHRIEVHPNAVDATLFRIISDKPEGEQKREARQRLGLPDDNRKIVLYVGRFYPWKGLWTLAEAAQILSHQGRYPITFYMVGGTEDEFLNMPKVHFIPPNMFFMGEKEHKDIPLWLAAADVLIAGGTKENDYSYLHTSPMKMFEYMRALRPIVASDTPANREVLSERNFFFFYRPDDPHDLARQIMDVFGAMAGALWKASDAYEAAKMFTWDKRARTILKTFQHS